MISPTVIATPIIGTTTEVMLYSGAVTLVLKRDSFRITLVYMMITTTAVMTNPIRAFTGPLPFAMFISPPPHILWVKTD